METSEATHRLFVVLILAIILLSTAATGVSAESFFDRRVLLDAKADARLRASLPDIDQSLGKLGVIVVFSSVPSGRQLDELRAIGNVRTFTGHVATIDVAPTLLGKLAALSFVERISKPTIMQDQLDVSVPEILAQNVWEEMKNSRGSSVDGSGVVIGIVDSGIDYRHKDFMFENGTNKILYIWDQTVPGRRPDGFDYGNECYPIDIQSWNCSEFDGGTNGQVQGHGTAIAAVAASTGESASPLDSCALFNGVGWEDMTAECYSQGGTPFPLLIAPGDYAYFGSSDRFNKLYFNLAQPGEYVGLSWEYSKGSGEWRRLQNDTNVIDVDSVEMPFYALSDGSSGLRRNGTFAFAPTPDWKPDSVATFGAKYWIRVSAAQVVRTSLAYRVLETPPYVGVAPGASIVAVKVKDGAQDHVLDGITYVVKKARELGMPVVINHSMGDSLGSHDGNEPLEIALTDMSKDGVPIVVSAGNSRTLDLHARGRLSSGQTAVVNWSNEESRTKNYIDLWYSRSDSLAVSVRTPSGEFVYGPTSERGVDTKDGNVLILTDEFQYGKELWIEISSRPGERLQMSPWSFILSANQIVDGNWDAWVEPGRFTSGGANYAIDPSDTIDFPGTADGVITVGSYVTRLQWRSGCTECILSSMSAGKFGVWTATWPAPSVGAIANSSSMGPTRDGRTKPEIVAPGAFILSARASTRAPKLSDPDNFHQRWDGTSFAAPHVAGAIALMLEMNPYLFPDQIKTILTQDARWDGFTGRIGRETGSNLWGWGKVNAFESTLDAPTLYAVRLNFKPIQGSLSTNVNLDGENVFPVPLNSTKPVVLEFISGEAHTLKLNPETIQVSPSVRYVVGNTTWKFSSGGVRSVEYRLQYFLEVASPYGNTTGTGWYDENTTAVANVFPLEVANYDFQGWAGSITSASPTIEVLMNSEKHLVALWRERDLATSPTLGTFLIAALVVIGIVSAAMLFRTRRVRLVIGGDSARRLRRLLFGS